MPLYMTDTKDMAITVMQYLPQTRLVSGFTLDELFDGHGEEIETLYRQPVEEGLAALITEKTGIGDSENKYYLEQQENDGVITYALRSF